MSDAGGSHPGRARLQIVAAALLFSTGGVFIKLLEGLTAWQRAGLRSLVAAAFLMAVWPRAWRSITRRSLLFGLFYAATMATFVAANTYTTSANAIFLQSTSPLYVLAIAPLLLREKVAARDVALMAAVAAGLALCFAGDLGAEAAQATAPRPLLGNAFAAVSGALWACTIVGLRWFGRGSAASEPTQAAAISGNWICFLGCGLIAGLAGEPYAGALLDLDLVRGSALLVLGCVQVGLAYVFLTRGIRSVPALQTALLVLVEPVFNPLWSYLFLSERPSGWSLLGGAVILSATAAHVVRRPPPTAAAAEPPH